MKVRVYHAGYGCDSGCCGHVVELGDGRSYFDFSHPYGDDQREYARSLAEEVIRKKWPECLDSIDWDTMEVEVSDD
jgi:hypothetical protein